MIGGEQIEEIKNKFAKLHSGDKEHLQAIFSDCNRIIVEAPAGSGKTKILISKIAYNIATKKIPQNKKILALTFSVNAAYKIKKDVATNLPELTSNYNLNPSYLNSMITVTNFHGFARRVLKKYGYLLNSKLKQIDSLESVSDNKIEDLDDMRLGLSQSDLYWITNFNKNIVSNIIHFNNNHSDFERYLNYVNIYFLPKNKITFNGYLIYLLQLFKKFPKLKLFYNQLYPIVIVDEFQDTNSLSWEIIKTLISPEAKLWFFGDPLQRIYGFIGAIDNLMSQAKKDFQMESVELHTNYRFKNNPELLNLDKNIRECAKNIAKPSPKSDAVIPTFDFSTIEEENSWLVDSIKSYLTIDTQDRLAILIKQRSKDINLLVEKLNAENVPFFYALFNDDDRDYINFHNTSLTAFMELIVEKKPRSISKQFLKNFYSLVEKMFKYGNQTEKSLLVLLKAFLKNLQEEYVFLDRDEKISYIVDILSNRSLKQSMEYVDAKIILSTVHGAKGLEWDRVIVRGLKNYSFPSFALCGKCKQHKINAYECCLDTESLSHDKGAMKDYLEELSVFYVAATRARQSLCMTTNEERYNSRGEVYNSQLSCFLRLPGIVPNFK